MTNNPDRYDQIIRQNERYRSIIEMVYKALDMALADRKQPPKRDFMKDIAYTLTVHDRKLKNIESLLAKQNGEVEN